MVAKATDAAPSAAKSILLVDDHPLFRRGLASLIDAEPDLAVCGNAATAAEALEAIAKRCPDLVIVDLALEGRDGLDLLKELRTRRPELPALVLSMHDELLYAERALRAGARGYLDKQQLDDTALVAIRRVLAGEIWLSERLERRLACRFLGGRTLETGSPLAVLSDRELEVFRWIGRGRSTGQIAETLDLSVKTIESHREHIKNKLGLENAAELLRRAALWVETGRSEG